MITLPPTPQTNTWNHGENDEKTEREGGCGGRVLRMRVMRTKGKGGDS